MSAVKGPQAPKILFNNMAQENDGQDEDSPEFENILQDINSSGGSDANENAERQRS